ncbi:MAG: hypothetical protein COU81_02255, partial [Candidatus Portnoybacteria bacterium CG10_big_fil_rev_8_21_14_0_10_36_7]
MRKISLAFAIFVLVLFFSNIKTSYAAEISGWNVSACFRVDPCYDIGEKDDDNPNGCTGDSHHLSRLALDPSGKPPSNSEVYITECVNVTADKTYCTTGDANLDKNLPPIDGHLGKLISEAGYDVSKGEVKFFSGANSADGTEIGSERGKLATDTLGNLILPGENRIIGSIEWKSWNPTILPRNFKIWTPVVATTDEENPASGIAGQQQADLTFSGTAQTKECDDYVSYDPEGRVFDAITLDPIPNVAVTLLQRDQTGNYTKEAVNQYNTEYTIINPQVTKSTNLDRLAGVFNFYVVDGFYKLVPSHGDYNFVDSSKRSQLPANVNKIYSNIYFSDSPPIEQKGKLEHRDIPLFPKDGLGKRYQPDTFKEIWYVTEAVNPTTIEYRGQVPYPFAKAIVQICNPQGCREGRVITSTAQGGPNNEGFFNIRLNQSVLQEGEYYDVKFEKVDLVNSTLSRTNFIWHKFMAIIRSISFAEKVEAQGSTLSRKIEPIISYLEGYAYDKNGKIIPNAKINIYVPFATGPIIQTTANANGYFRLTSEFIPATNYSLSYQKEGSADKTNISTSQFLAQNKEFIATEKINPYLKTTT